MELITVIPLEKTFLRVFDKPKNIRLNKQVIEFNYAHLSPFKQRGHLYFQADDKIYIWYLAQPLNRKNSVQVPEGYLIFRFFRERKNAVILLPRNDSLNVLVIVNGELRAQTTLPPLSDQEHSLDLLNREYALHNPEMIRLETTSRFNVKPADLLLFAHFELKPAEMLEKAVALAKGAVIAALLITAGFTLFQSTRLAGISKEKSSYLDHLKRDNAPLQASLDQVREQSVYWRNFIASEQTYPNYYLLLSQFTEVIRRHGGYINNVDFSDNRITVWTGLKSSEAAIIKDLLATGLFLEVKLLASSKDVARQDFNLYNLAITLRPQHKGEQS
jgi:hypothetical protein